MLCEIIDTISKGFLDMINAVGVNVLFFIFLAIEAITAIFFLVKSLFAYEARTNRALEKLNYWLFEKKTVTEENIRELNFIFKTKAPKRLCYYWQQYILFREGAPSSYLSTENLIEKPLKTSSYNSNIKNLTILSVVWAVLAAMFASIAMSNSPLTGLALGSVLVLPILMLVIGAIFAIYLRARKNSVLNSLYQNVQLFGRFMDNACIDLPTYIDYQILFTPQEIENGQPVLREFLDYKARKEKEEFNRAKEDNVHTESYDFSSTGVDGSIVLDRAMRESELYLKKKEKILLKISQLEAQLDSHRKNFDNIQKEYQTKLQASKENVDRLRQMQEETTNRIESNYYRKQQTQEIGKQEQLEQEFEQQRAKYMLEKNEGDEEIAKLNAELDAQKIEAETAMKNEYQTFFDKFCKSAEKVVAKVFEEKLSALKTENQNDKEYITELEIKLKNKPSESSSEAEDGHYDENGNYVYENGTYYDPDGNFHDTNGNVYSQDGKLISKAEVEPQPQEKQIVDFDDFDAFDFMTDVSQKDDVYNVAENVVNAVDEGFEVVNNTQKESVSQSPETEDLQKVDVAAEEPKTIEAEPAESKENVNDLDKKPEEAQVASAKKRGRPKKETVNEVATPPRKAGRPKKIVPQEEVKPKKSVGRPKKIVKETSTAAEKRGRGRPKKTDSIQEINKRLSEEEAKINELRNSLNKDLQTAMNGMNETTDEKMARRDELIKEIDRLQNEAKDVIARNESDSKIAEINAKLETLLDEIKKLN